MYVSHVMCNMSGVRCQVSGVSCQVSGIRCQLSSVRYQVSGVRDQVSGVFFSLFKVVELVRGGSVININSLRYFSSQSSKHHYSQTVTASDLKFVHNVHHPLCVTWHMSCVTCHLSHVMCQVAGVTCQISHVTCNSQTIRARRLKF